MDNKRIAIFVDFDNAQISSINMALNHCRNSQLWAYPLIQKVEKTVGGTVDIRKCYGNVMLNSSQALIRYLPGNLRDRISIDHDLQRDLLDNGFLMIHTPSFSGKNRADILIAIDCIEYAAKYEHIEYFAILTHDSDFSALIHKLKALSKKVIWITVADPEFRGKKSILSMVTERIIYDQSLIDEFGYDHVDSTLNNLLATNKDDLVNGIVFPVLHSKITESFPSFSYENLGFNKFKEFLESCIEKPYFIENDRVKFMESEVALINNGIVTERITEFHAALRKTQIRTLPELRKNVAKWLLNTLFDANGLPIRPMTYSELQIEIMNKFDSQQFSKSMIKDVYKLLVVSKILEFEESETFSTMKIKRIAPQDEYRKKLITEVISRLAYKGILISTKDVNELTYFIFGNLDEDYKRLIEEGITSQFS